MTDTPIATDSQAATATTAPAIVVDPTAVATQHHLVLVIDGVVQDMVTCEARLASILLSSPTIIELATAPQKNLIGWIYDPVNNQVTPPVE